MSHRPTEGEADRFLEALLKLDREAAITVLEGQLERGLPFLFDEVVRPAQIAVGELWHDNSLTAAEEHAATAIARESVSRVLALHPPPPARALALMACVEGELHSFGSQLVAEALRYAGWRAVNLDADVPTVGLVHIVKRLAPACVGLSVALPQHLRAAHEAIQALRAAAPQTHLLLGGLALAELMPGETFGADAVALTAAEAVAAARPWLPEAAR